MNELRSCVDYLNFMINLSDLIEHVKRTLKLAFAVCLTTQRPVNVDALFYVYRKNWPGLWNQLEDLEILLDEGQSSLDLPLAARVISKRYMDYFVLLVVVRILPYKVDNMLTSGYMDHGLLCTKLF